MSRAARLLAIGIGLAPLAAAAGVTEGAIAPPGECARAPQLPPPGPARSAISALFPPLDVAGGSADASQPGSGNPGRPAAQLFSDRGPCDDPGSGCAGPGGRVVIPPGGVLLPDGSIRFPDGSMLPAPGQPGQQPGVP
jgi:hypothetical protein